MEPHHFTSQEWATLLDQIKVLLVATITALCSGIAACIIAWRTGQKVENHDARAAARARELGHPANPAVHQSDRGHV